MVIVVLLWSAWQKTPENKEIPTQIVRGSQSYEVEPHKNSLEQRSFRFFDMVAPLVEPFEELLNITPSNPPYSKGEEQQNSPLSLRGARGVTGKPLTEQKIFNWIWPEDYRRGLAEIETLYINEGYIAQRPPTNFDDEENIYQFLALTLDVAETQKWIIPSDATILRKGLKETLPPVIEHDKNLLRQGLLPVSFLPKDTDITKLRLVIFANIAQASPGWVTSPDCYKDDAPFNPLPGPNLWAECCNCGWFCTPKGCKFFEDCEEQSVKCNVPAGCLNLTCRTFPNAIWDPTTGICGCG